jgi:hypothetical protein
LHQDGAQVGVGRRIPDGTAQFAGPGAIIDLPELGGALSVAEIVAEIYARLTL